MIPAFTPSTLFLLGAAPTVKPGHKHLKPIKEKAQVRRELCSSLSRELLPPALHPVVTRVVD